MRDAACATSPWLQSSSNLSGDDANASAILVRQIDACSKTYINNRAENEKKSELNVSLLT